MEWRQRRLEEPTSWSGGAAPNGQTDQATIAAPGTYDVAISGTETFTVAAATLDNATATLTLAVGAALAAGRQ